MTELLNTGKRIRRYRILCGMTQKALGMAVGFPQETADVRIAQYESGVRTPKQSLLCKMAQVLGVSPSVLDVPRIRNNEELYNLLIALEDECAIVFSPQSDNATTIYESHRERIRQMKEFEVTLTAVSKKTFKLKADNQEQAFDVVNHLMDNSNLLIFTDADVDSMDITCEEECGGVCELCGMEDNCPYSDEDTDKEDGFLFSR